MSFHTGTAASAWAVPSGVYRVKLATDDWELRRYWQLRQDVFCREQRLFTNTDLDENDSHAQPIVAVSYNAVMDDDVVGAVRIYEQSPGVWWGSRLAVAAEWRGVRSLAAGLIRCAVCTAHGYGCRTFLATVQLQNVPLFRRLHWSTLSEVEVCGKPHHLMQADLAHYPAERRREGHSGVVVTNLSATTRAISPASIGHSTICPFLEVS
ncbi:histone acetyltransferase [Humisphaera borealis]|uniref:Histone acetyltransferase n=2 Tax=Humisphaera borealis TaxID=2807512 RepID=A0A7M2X4L2_9BACT|nr:histone acetyltransferase [Humisphaera borealis]